MIQRQRKGQEANGWDLSHLEHASRCQGLVSPTSNYYIWCSFISLFLSLSRIFSVYCSLAIALFTFPPWEPTAEKISPVNLCFSPRSFSILCFLPHSFPKCRLFVFRDCWAVFPFLRAIPWFWSRKDRVSNLLNMDNAWQIKCGSSWQSARPPSMPSSSQHPPPETRDQVIFLLCFIYLFIYFSVLRHWWLLCVMKFLVEFCECVGVWVKCWGFDSSCIVVFGELHIWNDHIDKLWTDGMPRRGFLFCLFGLCRVCYYHRVVARVMAAKTLMFFWHAVCFWYKLLK